MTEQENVVKVHCFVSLKEAIGIIHVFSCINICRGSRTLFESEPPSDMANVNVLK